MRPIMHPTLALALAMQQAGAMAPMGHSVGHDLVGADFVGAGTSPSVDPVTAALIMNAQQTLARLKATGMLPATPGAPAGAAPPGTYPLQGRLPYGAPIPHFAPSRPRTVKRILLGFGSTSVAASATVPLISRPQKWFQPERLFIPAAQGTNFQVSDIKVGNVSMFLNVNAGSAVVFVENATDSVVTFDTADPAVDISVVVTNLDGGSAHTITPTMVGIAAV